MTTITPHRHSTPKSQLSRFTGTVALTRHALRRDRVLASVWIAIMVLLVYASAAATPALYSSEAERVHAAEGLASSPATVALYGRILDVHSVGELSMVKMTVLYALFASVLFVIIVRRHTRVDEERGLAELVGGTPVGRDAFYAAALVESLLLTGVLTVLAALASIGGGLPAAGSILFALSWAGTCLVGMGVAAVAVQLSTSARTCGAIAIGTMVGLYLVRAVGDAAWPTLSWFSPLGWNTELRAWSEPRIWVLGLYVVASLLLFVLAGTLRSRRDLGGGLLPDRPGRIHGSPWLASAFALTWRVNRTNVIVWTVVCAAMGTLMGAIIPVASGLLESNTATEIIQRMGGTGMIEDSLVTAILGVLAIGITCFAITVATHAAEDERSGRSEEVRATAVGRTSVWVATSVMAYVGAAWLVLLTGVAMGVGSGRSVIDVAGGAAAQIPAVWVTAAITLLAFAFGSRFAALGWAVLGAFVVVGFIGESINLPSWVTKMSPYQHVPKVPALAFEWAPELGLLAIAAALAVGGWMLFRYRDIG
ncbi:MAG: hypothetical protein LLG14_10340 [Nocardiaceae bacterium]|nr:hypothetical protein [Nocardiaceae bacterium]